MLKTKTLRKINFFEFIKVVLVYLKLKKKKYINRVALVFLKNILDNGFFLKVALNKLPIHSSVSTTLATQLKIKSMYKMSSLQSVFIVNCSCKRRILY